MSKGLYFITFIAGVDQCPLHTKVDAIDPMDAIKTFLTFWYRWKSLSKPEIISVYRYQKRTEEQTDTSK